MTAVSRWPQWDARQRAVVATKIRTGEPKRIALDPTTAVGGYAVADLVYRGDTLAELPDLAEVVIAEGEKAADAIVAAGHHAISFGSSSTVPSEAALDTLRDRFVVLWPDADRVGMDYMVSLAAALEPIVTGLRWIEPPADAPAGWDAADTDAWSIRRLVTLARRVPVLNGRMPRPRYADRLVVSNVTTREIAA